MCALKSATANPLGLSTFEKEHAPEAVTVPTVVGFQNPVATPLTRAIGKEFCPRSLPVAETAVFPLKVALLDTARVSAVRLEMFTRLRFVVPLMVRSLFTITNGASMRISCIEFKVICGVVGES